MFQRVTLQSSDVPAAVRGYAALIGSERLPDDLEIVASAAPTRGLHLGLRAPSPAAVDERRHAAGRAGFGDDGPPGLRPQYDEDYYGGFRLDPDGNSVDTMFYASEHPVDRIDHVWLRARDVAAMRAQFLPILALEGRWLKVDDIDLVRYSAPTGSLTIVRGEADTSGIAVDFGHGVRVVLPDA